MCRTAAARCRSSLSTGMITETEGHRPAAAGEPAGSGSVVAFAFIWGWTLPKTGGGSAFDQQRTAPAAPGRDRGRAAIQLGSWRRSGRFRGSGGLAGGQDRGPAGEAVGTPDAGLVPAPLVLVRLGHQR